MTNKKTIKRRRLKQQMAVPFARRDFPQEIIRRLEQITAISGRTRGQVFEDFVFLTEATLKVLPEQIKAVGVTGNFAQDPPEIAERFAQVRSHYAGNWLGQERTHRIWQHFGEAFALLLEATASGLWGEPNCLSIAGISGPDILGHIFQTWASPPSGRSWHGQVLTPFSVASCMARMLNIGLERMAYDRVKEALCHPDNVLGAAVLLTSLAIPEDETGAHFEWFVSRCLPAAGPYLRPILVQEPAVGTGIMIMAHAAASPAWAVRHNIIQYRAQDIDRLMVACTSSSLMLYGLNGYALQLEAAAAEAVQAYQQRSQHQTMAAETPSPGNLIRQVYRNSPAKAPGHIDHSFERMFRAVAEGGAVT